MLKMMNLAMSLLDGDTTDFVLSASGCFQIELSAKRWFQVNIEANLTTTENQAFYSLSGQLMLPVAAKIWVKSHVGT